MSSLSLPRSSMARRHRSDSIPEDRELSSPTLTPQILHNNNNYVGNINTNDTFSATGSTTETSVELLMRHSSPLVIGAGTAVGGLGLSSPLSERNSSPSPLRLNRPRSNPRTRTPNRAVIEDDDVLLERRVAQQLQETRTHTTTNEGRRITIRPMAGAPVGTNIAGARVSVVLVLCLNGCTNEWMDSKKCLVQSCCSSLEFKRATMVRSLSLWKNKKGTQ
jgi:hypothetical protein